MEIKQEHSSSGDNIAGDKIENNYMSTTDGKSISSKISSFEDYEKMDFTDGIVIKAFEELIVEQIKEEQQKCHHIVPIGHIRNYYKNYIQEEFFENTIKKLYSEKSIEVNKVQVCYVPKDLNYTIEL